MRLVNLYLGNYVSNQAFYNAFRIIPYLHCSNYSRLFDVPHFPKPSCVQYIPRNMHTVFALLCFVVVIHWLIFPYPSGLLHWHCGNLTIAPVPVKQPWWIWINTSCEFIMNDCITTTKQNTTKPRAYFLGYTVPYLHCSNYGRLFDVPHFPKPSCVCISRNALWHSFTNKV